MPNRSTVPLLTDDYVGEEPITAVKRLLEMLLRGEATHPTAIMTGQELNDYFEKTDAPITFRILGGRLPWAPDLKFSKWTVGYLATLSATLDENREWRVNPAKAVMWAYTLVHLTRERNGGEPVTLRWLLDNVLTHGIPTDEDCRRTWDAQKKRREGLGDTDNWLDNVEAYA